MPPKCYFPDGTVTDFYPCDPNSSTASTCCAGGDSCLSNGLCLSTQLFFYRGGCTDSLFPPAFCLGNCGKTDKATLKSVSLSTFQEVLPCDAYGRGFTCSGSRSDCSSLNFTLPVANITATKITGNAADASSSNASTILTVTTSASACPTSQTKNTGVSSTTLGVAVAVPVVVLSILALLSLFFFWREHKRRVNAETAAQNLANAATVSHGHPQDPKGPVLAEADAIGIPATYELPTTDGQGFYAPVKR